MADKLGNSPDDDPAAPSRPAVSPWRPSISRRGFLQAGGLVAGSAFLAACSSNSSGGGAATTASTSASGGATSSAAATSAAASSAAASSSGGASSGGASSSAASSTSAAPAAGKTTLKLMSWEQFEEGEKDAWNKVITDFTAANPNIEVQWTGWPFATYDQNVIAQAQAGGIDADVVMCPPELASALINKFNMCLPLQTIAQDLKLTPIPAHEQFEQNGQPVRARRDRRAVRGHLRRGAAQGRRLRCPADHVGRVAHPGQGTDEGAGSVRGRPAEQRRRPGRLVEPAAELPARLRRRVGQRQDPAAHLGAGHQLDEVLDATAERRRPQGQLGGGHHQAVAVATGSR